MKKIETEAARPETFVINITADNRYRAMAGTM